MKYFKLMLIQSLFVLLLNTNLYAQSIIVPANDGGGFARGSNDILPYLKPIGINQISILGSCLRGTNHFNKSNDKNIIWQSVNLPLTAGCEIPMTKKNFLGIVKIESYVVAYRKDKKDLGIEDFVAGKNQRVIGVSQTPWGPINDLSNNVWKNKNKVVWVGNSKDVIDSLLGNDIDYQILPTTWVVQNLDKVTPILNLGDKDNTIKELPNLVNLQKVAPGYPHSILEYYWLLMSNLDQHESESIRKKFAIIKQDSEYRRALFKSGVYDFNGDIEAEMATINQLIASHVVWIEQLKKISKK